MHTFTLPSGPEAGIVEMTGVEEDLLTNCRGSRKTDQPDPRDRGVAKTGKGDRR